MASWNGGLSSSGGYLAFYSCATNLVEGDTNKFGDIFIKDRGSQLGVGRLLTGERLSLGGASSARVSRRDGIGDVSASLGKQGADLSRVTIVDRPRIGDLLIKLDLEHMPTVTTVPDGTITKGFAPIVYGLRFKSAGKSLEVRGSSLLGGMFGLFECSETTCLLVDYLEGGYGTTGHNVTFSLPLDNIGLKDGGSISEVEAFSAMGTFLTGGATSLDTLRIR